MGKFKGLIKSLSKSQKITTVAVLLVIAILAIVLAVITVNAIL